MHLSFTNIIPKPHWDEHCSCTLDEDMKIKIYYPSAKKKDEYIYLRERMETNITVEIFKIQIAYLQKFAQSSNPLEQHCRT